MDADHQNLNESNGNTWSSVIIVSSEVLQSGLEIGVDVSRSSTTTWHGHFGSSGWFFSTRE